MTVGAPRTPVHHAWLDLSYRCNLRCRFCWYYGDHGVLPDRHHEEMSAAQIRIILDKLADATEVRAVVLTGAEPIFHPEVWQVIGDIKRRGWICFLLTNGTIVTADVAERLVGSQLDGVRISVDGNEASHEAIRGDSMFARTVNGIRRIQSAKEKAGVRIPQVTINSVIGKGSLSSLVFLLELAAELDVELNYQHLMWLDQSRIEKHRRILREELGVEDRTVEGFENEFHGVDPEALTEALETVKNRSRGIGKRFSVSQFRDVLTIGAWYSPEGSVRGGCTFLDGHARITSYGDLVPCQFIDYSFGSILQESFGDIWSGARKRKFDSLMRLRGLLPMCERCCKLRIDETGA